MMTTTRDWSRNKEMWIGVLEKQTAEGLEAWKAKMRRHKFRDEQQLRTWLSRRNVTGYAQQLLVMERFWLSGFHPRDGGRADRPAVCRRSGAARRLRRDCQGRHELRRSDHSGAQDVCVAGLASADVRAYPASQGARQSWSSAGRTAAGRTIGAVDNSRHHAASDRRGGCGTGGRRTAGMAQARVRAERVIRLSLTSRRFSVDWFGCMIFDALIAAGSWLGAVRIRVDIFRAPRPAEGVVRRRSCAELTG